MAFQSVPETAEITINCSLNGRPLQNTYHARFVGGYSLGVLQSLADAIDAWAGSASVLATWSNALSYAQTEVRGLEFENDVVAVASASAGPGTRTSAELPLNVSFVIKRLSGFTGRSARGRVYYFGLTIDQMQSNSNFVISGQADIMRDVVIGFRTVILAEGGVPVIVSRFSGGAPRASGITFVWESTTYTDLRLDSRRGRMP